MRPWRPRCPVGEPKPAWEESTARRREASSSTGGTAWAATASRRRAAGQRALHGPTAARFHGRHFQVPLHTDRYAAPGTRRFRHYRARVLRQQHAVVEGVDRAGARGPAGVCQGFLPPCAAIHKTPPLAEDVVVGPDGGLENVVIYISEGLPDMVWDSARTGALRCRK